MPTSREPWAHETAIVTEMETMLYSGSLKAAGSDDTWRSSIRKNFDKLSVKSIADTSQQVIREAPYDDISATLDNFKGDEALIRLRKIRKLFLIARDGIILSHSSRPDEEFDDLFTFCKSLGRIADNLTVPEDTERGRKALINLADTGTISFPTTTDEGMVFRIEQILGDSATLDSRNTKQSADEYHEKRKAFRRVVHVVLLQTVASRGDMTLTNLALEGLALNTRYGDQKDTMFSEQDILELNHVSWIY